MNPSQWESEFVKLVGHHFAFLTDLGYTEPIIERHESALYVLWIDLVYLSASPQRSCRISFFLLQHEGRITLSLTRDQYRTHDDFLDFQMYLEKRLGTSVPWTFPVKGSTESEMLARCEAVLSQNAQALREHGLPLLDGSSWEAGYYHRKD